MTAKFRHLMTRLLPLLVLVTMAVALPALAQDAGGQAITLTGRFHMQNTLAGGPAEQILAAVAIEPQGQSRALALVWTRVEDSWFPYWALQVRSQHDFLHRGNVVELARVSPVADRKYDWAFSVDAALGALSVQVTDTHTGQSVYNGGFDFKPYDGKLYPAAGMEQAAVQGYYLPVGTRWEPGLAEQGSRFLPLRRFEADAPATIRLTVPGPAPRGQFQLILDDPAGATVLAGPLTIAESATWLPLTLEDLPLGRSHVRLEYVEGETVLLSLPQEIIVGDVTARFGPQVRKPEAGVLAGTVILQSQSYLPDVDVAVYASFGEMVWDPAMRDFRSQPLGEPVLALQQRTDILVGDVTLAYEVPIPDKQAVWEVTLEAVVTPDVVAHLGNVTHYTANYPAANIAPDEPFTVVVLPDTQYFAKNFPHIYMRIGEWIAANAAEKNIAFILHMGDVTNENTHEQWRRAANSMKLWNDIVPYTLAVGNHDYVPDGRPGGQFYNRNTSKINDYFWPEEFPHLGGMLDDGRLENAYYTINVAGIDFLIIVLEFGPPDEAIAWANAIAAEHPDHFGIVVSHTYTSPSGSRNPRGYVARSYEIANDLSTTVNDAEDMWAKFVSRQPNIHMVLSGHRYSPAIPLNVARGMSGNTVYEMLTDYQSEDFGGNGYFALFEFRPDGRVKVSAYSPFLDEWKTDISPQGFTNAFTLNFEHVLPQR